MCKEACLRCEDKKNDPEFPGEPCRVCHGSGAKQSDIVLKVQNIKTSVKIADLIAGRRSMTIE